MKDAVLRISQKRVDEALIAKILDIDQEPTQRRRSPRVKTSFGNSTIADGTSIPSVPLILTIGTGHGPNASAKM